MIGYIAKKALSLYTANLKAQERECIRIMHSFVLYHTESMNVAGKASSIHVLPTWKGEPCMWWPGTLPHSQEAQYVHFNLLLQGTACPLLIQIGCMSCLRLCTSGKCGHLYCSLWPLCFQANRGEVLEFIFTVTISLVALLHSLTL